MAAAPAVNHANSMTPPSAADNPELWEYSVPVDAPFNYRRKPSLGFRDRDYSELHVQKTRRTGDSVVGGGGSSGGGRSRQSSTSTHHTQARSYTEPTNGRSQNNDRDRYQPSPYDGPESYNDENNPPSWADQASYDYESSRWIHRDKLAEIESQELRSAGIYVLPSERLEIDSGSLKRKRLSTGFHGDGEDGAEADGEPAIVFDCRTQEEIMAEQMRLKNGSKIPLATTSPMPVPTSYMVRNTPLKRPQPSPEGTPQTHNRKRSHSTGSNYLLDTTPIKAPPTTSKSAHTTPTSTLKSPSTKPQLSAKAAGKVTSLKKRTRSNPALNARPKTSSAALPTSPTKDHFLPDGPPPWAVASYQPDPSLPPDQQIIPTVAKRLAQERWEREGAFADVYDRKLRPLRVQDEEALMSRRKESLGQRDQAASEEADRVREEREAERLREEMQAKRASKRASYSTVPPPDEPRPAPQMNGSANTPKIPKMAPPIEPIRVQDPEAQRQEEEKKRGMCCCIIM